MTGVDQRNAVEITPADLDLVRTDQEALRTLRTAVRLARDERRSSVAEARRWVTRFLLGQPIERRYLADALGASRVEHLLALGALTAVREHVVLGFGVVFMRDLAVAYPSYQREDYDLVYVGLEAPWLLRLAWDVAPPGSTAIDLATGTGVLAAALSARFDHVIASDVTHRTASCAALTLALNASPRTHTMACVADVGSGLRGGAADLVVANPPWVPDDPTGEGHLFADGGRTGMELPARFIRDAARLLAPNGVAVIAVLDTTWADGSRPLQEPLDELQAAGFEASLHPAHPTAWGEQDSADLLGLDGCTGGRLMGLVFSRSSARTARPTR